MPTKVLVVEDNQDMRRGLQQFLEREGFDVVAVASCEDGIDEVDENSYDAGVIDINLPGKSGFELIEYIREQGKTIPLIAMTARDGIEDKIKGFDLGLTDYIVKPFNLKEMLARLNTHLKRTSSSSDILETGPFALDQKSLQFTYKDAAIELTQLEFRIMTLLIENVGSLVTIDDLIEFAWGEQDGLSNPPVRIHIANLRKKIDDTDYQVIRTIPGTGYILSSEVAK